MGHIQIKYENQIVEPNMSASPEQCSGEQEQCPVYQDIMSWTMCCTKQHIVVDSLFQRREDCYGGTNAFIFVQLGRS